MRKIYSWALIALMALSFMSCKDDDEPTKAFTLAELTGTYILQSSTDEDFVECTSGDVETIISSNEIEIPGTDLTTGCQVGALGLSHTFANNTFTTDFGSFRVLSFDGDILKWEYKFTTLSYTETLKKK